jgi:hypothetical protein
MRKGVTNSVCIRAEGPSLIIDRVDGEKRRWIVRYLVEFQKWRWADILGWRKDLRLAVVDRWTIIVLYRALGRLEFLEPTFGNLEEFELAFSLGLARCEFGLAWRWSWPATPSKASAWGLGLLLSAYLWSIHVADLSLIEQSDSARLASNPLLVTFSENASNLKFSGPPKLPVAVT